MEKRAPYIPVEAWVVGKQEEKVALHHDVNQEHGPAEPGHMRLIDGLKMREVAGQTLLTPVGDAVSRVRQSAVLNREAAALVRMMMDGEFTVDAIVEKGLHTFQVEEPVLRRDVEKLVDNLCLAGMLEGDEVEKRLRGATTTLSGVTVMENGRPVSSKVESVRRSFKSKD